MKEALDAPNGSSVEIPAEAAHNEAAAALAEVPRGSGETILVQVRRNARPLLVVAAASVALVYLWRLSRKDAPPRFWQPRPQPSLLSSTVRTVALSLARVALSRLVDRVVSRATVQVVAEQPAS